MEFNLPTTKEEMYVILNDLFYHYRIKRQGYEEVSMQELSLARLEFVPDTDEQLTERARALVNAENEREIISRKDQLNSKAIALSAQIETAESSLNERIENIKALYAESEEKLRVQAVKNGLINSSVYLDKLAYLESEKNLAIDAANAQNEQLVGDLTAQTAEINSQLIAVEEYYSSVHEKSVIAKTAMLKAEQDEIVRETFKYNNGLDEKEQRYKNTILQANASLNLKFMEISMGEFTKDQLVDMGYYDDVIKCVCGYYDALEAVAAYHDINSESKLTIYLDDYYQNIVYMYGVRSGLIG